METTEDRRAVHCYLSEGSHTKWHETAAESGVSVSGLIEAMAEDLEPSDEVIIRARKVDAARRRRRP